MTNSKSHAAARPNPGSTPHRVVKKTINWAQDQPAPKEAFMLIHLCFPQARNGGIHVPKKTGGKPSGHSFGRAVDVMLSAHKPLERAIGDGLFQSMIDSADGVGIDHVIWNKQIWSRQHPKIRSFAGTYRNGEQKNPHTDHIHIEWTESGSQFHRSHHVEAKLQSLEAPRALESRLGILQSNLEELGIYGDSRGTL